MSLEIESMLEFLKSWGGLATSLAASVLAFVAPPVAIRALSTPMGRQNAATSGRSPAGVITIRMPQVPSAATTQWSSIAAVIDRASSASASAEDFQSKALVQLEAAEFAIDRIFDEVAAVMVPTPGMLAMRKRVT